MKKKIEKKLSLSRETLHSLDETSLTGVVGGEPTNGTNACSLCCACTSCYATCILNTEGVCC